MNDDSLKQRAHAIAQCLLEIPIAMDKTHLNKRRKLRQQMLDSAKRDGITGMDLDHLNNLVSAYMNQQAKENRHKNWRQSNSLLYLG